MIKQVSKQVILLEAQGVNFLLLCQEVNVLFENKPPIDVFGLKVQSCANVRVGRPHKERRFKWR